MGWAYDYDNAERVLFYTKDQKLSNGKEVFSFITNFTQVLLGGQLFIETCPVNIALNNTAGVSGEVDVKEMGSRHNKFVQLQLAETESFRSYNADNETLPLFGQYLGV